MIKGCTYCFSHIFAGNLCFHYRILRILLTEVVVETERSSEINRVLKGHIPVIAALQDLDQLTASPFVYHIKASVFVFVQETNEFFPDHARLIQIGIFIFSFAHCGEAGSSCIKSQSFFEFFRRFEVQIYFIREILNTYAIFIVWWHDMDIEVTLWLGCASLSRQSHKQIAFPEHIMSIPVQVIFVNIEICYILLGIPFQAAVHNIVERTVQFIISKKRCLLLDLLIVVNNLINVNVILVVCIIENNELTRNGSHDFFQCHLYSRQKEISILFRHHHVQAQIVL